MNTVLNGAKAQNQLQGKTDSAEAVHRGRVLMPGTEPTGTEKKWDKEGFFFVHFPGLQFCCWQSDRVYFIIILILALKHKLDINGDFINY